MNTQKKPKTARVIKNMLKTICAAAMFAFVFLSFYACGGAYGSVKITLYDSSNQVVNNAIVFERDAAPAPNTFTINATVSGMPSVASSAQPFLIPGTPEIVRCIDTQPISENTAAFTFEARYSGTGIITFGAEGGKHKQISIIVKEDVRSFKVDPSYRPALIRGTTFDFDMSKIIYNDIDIVSTAVDASEEYKGVDMYIVSGASSPGVTLNQTTKRLTIAADAPATQVTLRFSSIHKPGLANAQITLPVVDAINPANAATSQINLAGGGMTVQPEINAQGVPVGSVTLFSNTTNVNATSAINLSYVFTNANLRSDKVEFLYEEYQNSGSGAAPISQEKSIFNFQLLHQDGETAYPYATTNATLTVSKKQDYVGNSAVRIYAQVKGQPHTRVLYAIINLRTIVRPEGNIVDVSEDGGGRKAVITGNSIEIYKKSTMTFNISSNPGSSLPLLADEFNYVLLFRNSGGFNLFDYLIIENADGSPVESFVEPGAVKVWVKSGFKVSLHPDADYGTVANLNKLVTVYAAERVGIVDYEYRNSDFNFYILPKIGVEEVNFTGGFDEIVEDSPDANIIYVRIDKASEINRIITFDLTPNASEISEDSFAISYADYAMRNFVSFNYDIMTGTIIIMPHFITQESVEIVCSSKSLARETVIIVEVVSLPRVDDETVVLRLKNSLGQTANYYESNPVLTLPISATKFINASLVAVNNKSNNISTQTTFAIDRVEFDGSAIWVDESDFANGMLKIYGKTSSKTTLTIYFVDQAGNSVDAAGNPYARVLTVQTYKEVFAQNIVISKDGQLLEKDTLYGRANSNDYDKFALYSASLMGFILDDYIEGGITFGYEFIKGFDEFGLGAATPRSGSNIADVLVALGAGAQYNCEGEIEIRFNVFINGDLVTWRSFKIAVRPSTPANIITANTDLIYFTQDEFLQQQQIKATLSTSGGVAPTKNAVWFESFDSTIATVDALTGVVHATGPVYNQHTGEWTTGIGKTKIAVHSWDGAATIYIDAVVADGITMPYIIRTAEQLAATEGAEAANYILWNNIDMHGANWQPISFAGVIDGNDKTIFNFSLNYNAGAAAQNIGLFSIIDGYVHSLNIDHRSINIAGSAYVFGLLAAEITQPSMVYNVNISGNGNIIYALLLNENLIAPHELMCPSFAAMPAGSSIVSMLNNKLIVLQEGTSAGVIATSIDVGAGIGEGTRAFTVIPKQIVYIYDNSNATSNFALDDIFSLTLAGNANPLLLVEAPRDHRVSVIGKNVIIKSGNGDFVGEVEFTVTYPHITNPLTQTVKVYFVPNAHNVLAERTVSINRTADDNYLSKLNALYKTTQSNPAFKTSIIFEDSVYKEIVSVNAFNSNVVVFKGIINVSVLNSVKDISASIINNEGQNTIDLMQNLIVRVYFKSTVPGDNPIAEYNYNECEVTCIETDNTDYWYFLIVPKAVSADEFAVIFRSGSSLITGGLTTLVRFKVVDSAQVRIQPYLFNEKVLNYETFASLKNTNASQFIYTNMNMSEDAAAVDNYLIIEADERDDLRLHTVAVVGEAIINDGQTPHVPKIYYNAGDCKFLTDASGKRTPYFAIPLKLDQQVIGVDGTQYITEPGQRYKLTFTIFFETLDSAGNWQQSSTTIMREAIYTAQYPLNLTGVFAGTSSNSAEIIRGNDFSVQLTLTNYLNAENIVYTYEVLDVNSRWILSSNEIADGILMPVNNRINFTLSTEATKNFCIAIKAYEIIGGIKVPSTTATLRVNPLLFGIDHISLAVYESGRYIECSANQQLSPSNIASFKLVPKIKYGDQYHAASSGSQLRIMTDNAVKELEYALNDDIENILQFASQGSNWNRIYEATDLFDVITKSNPLNNVPLNIAFNVINTTISFKLEARIGKDETDLSNSSVYKYYQGNAVGALWLSKTINIVLTQSSTDDNPLPIYTADDLRKFLTINEISAESNLESTHLILLDDITIDYSWFKEAKTIEANFASLDGNGFVINLKSGAFDAIEASINPEDVYSNENPLNIGLFTKIGQNTTIKNITLGIETRDPAKGTAGVFCFAAKTTFANVEPSVINFGLLAGQNEGIITNAKITAVTMSPVPNREVNGKMKNTLIADLDNTAEIRLLPFFKGPGTPAVPCLFNAGSLIGQNNGFITNSRVLTTLKAGGTFREQAVNLNENAHLNIAGDELSTGYFVIGGIAAINNNKIASTFFNASIYNNSDSPFAYTAGFAAFNRGDIVYSYVEGGANNEQKTSDALLRKTNHQIRTNTAIGGFVYENNGYIGNCYSNIQLRSFSLHDAGFAMFNRKAETTDRALIEFCFSLCISEPLTGYTGGTSKPFYGGEASEAAELLAGGTIENCYFLEFSNNLELSNIKDAKAAKLSLSDFQNIEKWSGFAFGHEESSSYIETAAGSGVYIKNTSGNTLIAEGAIWRMDERYIKNNDAYIRLYALPKLVSADEEIDPTRKFVRAFKDTTGNINFENDDNGAEEGSSIIYLYHYTECEGSAKNPKLISNEADFEEIYTDAARSVGDKSINRNHYRLISDITFPRGQTAKSQNVVMSGVIDGNGMQISNIYINGGETEQGVSEDSIGNSIGMFGHLQGEMAGEKLKPAVIKGLRLSINNFYGSQIEFAGGLVGRVTDGNVFDISVTSGNNCIVYGKNIVGGVIGLVEGDSLIYNLKSDINIISTHNVSAVDSASGIQSTIKSERFTINSNDSKYTKMSYAGGAIGALNSNAMSGRVTSSAIYVNNCIIEGGYVGGVVGYIGEQVYATDYRYIATASSLLQGRNATGGVIGENRGNAIFFASEYEPSIQKEIDKIPATGRGNFGTIDKVNPNIFSNEVMGAAGGIIGLNFNGSLKQSYSKLPINNENAVAAGGLVGISVAGQIDMTYASASVTASDYAGGLIGVLHTISDDEAEEIEGLDKYIDSLSISNSFALNGYNSRAVANADSLKTQVKHGGLIGYIRQRDSDPVINVSKSYNNYYNNDSDVLYTAIALAHEDWLGSYSGHTITDADGKPIDDPTTNPAHITPLSSDNMDAILSNFSTTFTNGKPDSFSLKYNILEKFYNPENINWQNADIAVKEPAERFPKIINFQNPYAERYEIDSLEKLIEYSSAQYSYAQLVLTHDVVVNASTLAGIGAKITDIKFESFSGMLVSENGSSITLNGVNPLFKRLNSGTIIRGITFNITRTGKTTSDSNVFNCGGIADVAINTSFENCTVTYALDSSVALGSSGKTSNIGAFVGNSLGNNRFTSCTVAGFTVDPSNTQLTGSTINVGSFVGRGKEDIYDTCVAEDVIIDIPYNNSNSGISIRAGGFVGYAINANRETIYAAGCRAGKNDGTDSSTINIGGHSTTTASNNIGGFAGLLIGAGTIDGFINNIQITAAHSFEAVGGIIGSGQTTFLNNCSTSKMPAINNTNIYSKYLGLFAGEFGGGNLLFANISGVLGMAQNVGAIAGRMYNGRLTNSFATATNVVGTGNTGGLVGVLDGISSIESCFSTNDVIGNTGNTSGLVGATTSGTGNSYSIINCYSAGTLSGGTVGGLIGSRPVGTLRNVYFAGKIVKSNTADLICNGGGTITYSANSLVFALREISAGYNINVNASQTDDVLKSFNWFTQQGWSFNNSSAWVAADAISRRLPYLKSNNSAFTAAQTDNMRITATPFTASTTINAANQNNLFILEGDISAWTVSTGTTSATAFKGTLIGNGYSIAATTPIFRYITNAFVSGVKIKNNILATTATDSVAFEVYTTGTAAGTTTRGGIFNSMAGGVVAYSYSALTLTFDADSTDGAGGLVGTAENSPVIRQSFFSGEIYNAGSQVGTIAGNGTATIQNCYSTGSIFGSGITTVNQPLNGISGCYSISFIESVAVPNMTAANKIARDGIIWENSNESFFPRLKGFDTSGPSQALGTRVNPFKVTDYESLQNIGNDSYYGDNSGAAAYIIMGEINLGGPAGAATKMFSVIPEFSGTLYGASGSKIKNFTMRSYSGIANHDDYMGMFGQLSGALVVNVYFDNPTVTFSQVTYAGVLAGEAEGRTAVVGCKITDGTLFAAAHPLAAKPTARVFVGDVAASAIEWANNTSRFVVDTNIISINSAAIKADALPTAFKFTSGIKAISSADEFVNYFREVNNYQSFKLTKDIDLTGTNYNWAGFDFYGTFDGDGFKIIGLNGTSFVLTNHGTIKNLCLQNSSVSVVSSSSIAIGLVAENNIGTITNCYAFGAVTAGSQRGSIVGSGTITNCYGAAYSNESGSVAERGA